MSASSSDWCVVCVNCDWPERLLWFQFYETQLKTTLSSNASYDDQTKTRNKTKRAGTSSTSLPKTGLSGDVLLMLFAPVENEQDQTQTTNQV